MSKTAPNSTPEELPAAPTDALAAFRARIESGRFAAVLGRALRRTIRDAAADAGLDAEVGALRLALARLLTEESDPSRLAAGVARLAAVAVQAARLRRPPDSEVGEFQDLLLRELDAYEAELAAAKSGAPLEIDAGNWPNVTALSLEAQRPPSGMRGRGCCDDMSPQNGPPHPEPA